jgi:trk system potassium uptake protein TrkA
LALAKRLEEVGRKVALVEESLELARKAEGQLQETKVLHGQVTDRVLLEDEGIRDVSTFVAVTPDHEVNVVSSLLAKRLGANRTFALVDNPALANLIGDLGIDAVISPRLLAVSLTLQHIRRGRIRSGAALLEDQVEVMEAEAVSGSRLTSEKLSKIVLPRGIVVAAILRGDRLLLPGGDDRVEAGDRVLIFTTSDKAKRLDELLSVE